MSIFFQRTIVIFIDEYFEYSFNLEMENVGLSFVTYHAT